MLSPHYTLLSERHQKHQPILLVPQGKKFNAYLSIRLVVFILGPLFLIIQSNAGWRYSEYPGFGPVTGHTPCCVDGLTTLTCKDQKRANVAAFMQKCMSNPDFAFVQCCKTCFNHDSEDIVKLDYEKASNLLLTNPISTQCTDRRGKTWCNDFVYGNFVKSRNSPQVKSQNSYKLDCSNTLIAFRVCRKSCGFCSNDERSPAHAVYNFKLANDAWRCRNPAIGIVQESGRNQTIKKFWDFAKRFSKREK